MAALQDSWLTCAECDAELEDGALNLAVHQGLGALAPLLGGLEEALTKFLAQQACNHELDTSRQQLSRLRDLLAAEAREAAMVIIAGKYSLTALPATSAEASFYPTLLLGLALPNVPMDLELPDDVCLTEGASLGAYARVWLQKLAATAAQLHGLVEAATLPLLA